MQPSTDDNDANRVVPRSRWLALPALLLVASAVALRFLTNLVMRFLTEYGEDILVALAAYLFLGAVLTRWPGWKVLLLTIVLTWGLQVAELFHPAWMGPYWARLHFEWSDIASHTVGALIGFGGEKYVARLMGHPTRE